MRSLNNFLRMDYNSVVFDYSLLVLDSKLCICTQAQKRAGSGHRIQLYLVLKIRIT